MASVNTFPPGSMPERTDDEQRRLGELDTSIAASQVEMDAGGVDLELACDAVVAGSGTGAGGGAG